jgi:glycine oxidase
VALTGHDHEAGYDAVVVGAGVVGLSCAWRAAQRGLRVLVVERDEPGAGASGVAAGMLAPASEADFGERELLALLLEGAASWPGFRSELEEASGLDAGYRKSGALLTGADADELREVRRLFEYQSALGLDVSWLTGRECRRLEPGLSPRVGGGVHAPHDHQVDPRRTIRALRAAFEREGGTVETGTEVLGLLVEDERVAGVRTAAGERRAPRVVLAAGAWSRALEGVPEALRPPVRPVKGQILSLRGPAEGGLLATRLIRTPRCYVVCRADGQVVVGATVEERGWDLRVTGEGIFRLLEAAWEVLPDVLELEWEGARAGLRPGSPDNAPVVGEGGLEGLVWATAHYRHGVLLAPLTGEAVAALLAGAEPPSALAGFGPERFARTVAGGAA